MINIIITAGGTIEDIDGVRKITNTSTGTLGTLICNEIIKQMTVSNISKYRIHYIVGESSVKPSIDIDQIENVIIYEISNVESVLKTINMIMGEYKINYFIHSMAVSDFTTSYTISINDLAEKIEGNLKEASNDKWRDIIIKTLKDPEITGDVNKKISSKSELLIGLKKTTKIISTIKDRDKDIFLVGFKLLKNVSEEELLDAANDLAKENLCDLVFANDLKDINKEDHKGILIKDNKIIERLDGKRNIAKAIVYQMLKGVI